MSSRLPSPEGNLICVICQNEYDDPRILPCLHTFCATCIEKIDPVQFQQDDNASNSLPSWTTEDPGGSGNSSRATSYSSLDIATILCPICENAINIARTVQRLPINYMIRKRLKQNSSRNRIPVYCDLCSGNHLAVSFCVNCDHNLCRLCREAHRRQNKTLHHFITELLNDTNKTESDRISCSWHGQDCNLFCDTCDRLICSECLLQDHQTHICVFAEDILELESKNLDTELNKLRPLKNTLQSAMKSIQTACDRVDNKKDSITSAIDVHIERYIEALKTYRERLLDQLETVRDKRTKQLKMQKIELEQNLADICHGIRFTEELLLYGTTQEILDCKRSVSQRLKTLSGGEYKTEPSCDDYVEFLPHDKGDQVNGYRLFGTISFRQVDAQRSIATGEALQSVLEEGHKSVIILITKDKDGEPMRKGGSDVKARLYSQEDRYLTSPVQIKDRRDGNYEISFVPDHGGRLLLSITINGRQIKNSPFSLVIKARRRESSGYFHGCTECRCSGGRKDKRCACGASIADGLDTCGRGQPGTRHWPCCGQLIRNNGTSSLQRRHVHQVTL